MRGKSKPSESEQTTRRDTAADAGAPPEEAVTGAGTGSATPEAGVDQPAGGPVADGAGTAPDTVAGTPGEDATDAAGGPSGTGTATGPGAGTDAGTATESPDDAEILDGQVVEAEVVEEPPTAPGAEAPPVENHLAAELGALRKDLDEMTRDLQRVTAEYANYRRRVDRDRALITEQAVGTVLTALLPVLDDLDRARDHGDLVGPFGSVAEQLLATLGKFGLSSFGEKGDPFDPTRHEAVAHQTSEEVTESTCVDVMRRGYMLGDRLLRAALVAVADPQ